MFWLKCCPKCGGDLYEDHDHYGAYISCVQCGYYLTEAEEVLLKFAARQTYARATKEEPARTLIGAGKST